MVKKNEEDEEDEISGRSFLYFILMTYQIKVSGELYIYVPLRTCEKESNYK